MKQFTFLLLTLLFFAQSNMISWTQTTDDFLYFENDDGTITISDYIGLETNIIIPETINDKTVTVIGYHAFSQDTLKLTSVVIPNSITHIWHNAFIYNSLTTIDIPNSVIYIGSYAFFGNLLETINIGNSVEYIGNMAFALNHIEDVVIPNSVKHIDGLAFDNNSLTEIIIPNSVVYIGPNAFANNSLTSFILSEAVLGDADFIKWIDDNGNSYNSNAEVTEFNVAYSAVFDGEHFLAVNDRQGFGNANSTITAYIGNETDVTIPMNIDNDLIYKIGTGAFQNRSLANVNFHNSIRIIGHSSFKSNSLSSVNIPNSVISIYYQAFEDNLFDSFVLPEVEREGGIFEYWEDDEGNRYLGNSTVSDLKTCYNAVFNFNPLSINSPENINLKVYPNPANNIIVIESSAQENISNIEIYSIKGNKLYQHISIGPSVNLDMSNYPSGTLLLKITCNNKKIIVFKILKR